MSHRITGRSARGRLSQLLRRILGHFQRTFSHAGTVVARCTPFVGGGRRELGFAEFDLPDSFFDPLPASELRYWSNCDFPEARR